MRCISISSESANRLNSGSDVWLSELVEMEAGSNSQVDSAETMELH